MRHVYYIEFLIDGVWSRTAGCACGREFGHGYLAALREGHGPRLAARLMRDDGKEVDFTTALEEVSIGPVAGHPTAAQYRAAAAHALAKAEELEKRQAERRK